MNLEEIQAFEADLNGDQTLTPKDRTVLRDKFFAQRIRTSPEWVDAPPDVRFKFAKQFGVSPGLAQQFEGEFYVRGGKPVTGEFGEGPFESGIMPMPQGDLGETQAIGGTFGKPSGFMGLGALMGGEGGGTLLENFGDPTNAITGGAAALAGKIPMIGSMLAAKSPLLREAARLGVLRSGLDWQTMGLHRLPGWIGRRGSDVLSRFRGGGPTAPTGGGTGAQMNFQFPQEMAPMGRPGPASGAPALAPEIAGGSAPRMRLRYGPGGIEDITQ